MSSQRSQVPSSRKNLLKPTAATNALLGRESADPRPRPDDFLLFLPYATSRLQMPYLLRIIVEQQEVLEKVRDRRSKLHTKSIQEARSKVVPLQETRSKETPPHAESGAFNATNRYADVIVLKAVHDAAGHLVEIKFQRTLLPRQMLQVLALCLSHQPLLTRLTVRHCKLQPYTLHEMAKLTPTCNLSDVCLDDSPAPEGSYHLLLDNERLRRLSLERCGLDDDDVAELAERLTHPRPASRGLRALSLVSNAIGDDGARALAAALRSNRALHYLNLAGNRVTDEGAAHLLRSLDEFPLTCEEIAASRRDRLERLQRWHAEVRRCEAELAAAAAQAQREWRHSRPAPAAVPTRRRAEAMAAEALAASADAAPFGAEETVARDGYPYSRGNRTLCALNLSHNDLQYGTVAALRRLLRRQAGAGAAGGLLRVVLDGNDLPRACAHYRDIDQLLERTLSARIHQVKKTDKKK